MNHTNFGMIKEEDESPRTQQTVVDIHPEQNITSTAQMRCGNQELPEKMELPVECLFLQFQDI